MKVAGVIAEFDPFHNGHAFFLRRVREVTSADFIIAVMSGDFTQRGNIAIGGKRLRTEAALLNGADIVIELPVQYATASAETFATGGISILKALNCVDAICFGTEEEDIKALKSVARIFENESGEFKENISDCIKEGMSYPKARLEAAVRNSGAAGKGLSGDRIAEILCQPNNILAIEYIKAVSKLWNKREVAENVRDKAVDIKCDKVDIKQDKINVKCKEVDINQEKVNINKEKVNINQKRTDIHAKQGLTPELVNIKRQSVDHDSVNTYGIYSSAKNIRNTLERTNSPETVAGFMPDNTKRLMEEHFGIDYPTFNRDLSSLLRYRLIMEEADSLMKYADMSAELARRIEKHKNDYIDISQFTELIKTRNLTYTRISRALLHVLLSIKKDSMKEYAEYGYTGYARVLGFKKGASELIRFMNEKANVPVITRCAEYKGKLKHPFKEMYEEDLKASLIRDLIVKEIYDTDLTGDLARITVTKDDMILG